MSLLLLRGACSLLGSTLRLVRPNRRQRLGLGAPLLVIGPVGQFSGRWVGAGGGLLLGGRSFGYLLAWSARRASIS